MRVANFAAVLVVHTASLGLALAATAAERQPRSPAEYAAAEKRLTETYSLDRVAKERIEVRAEDLEGMATPLSYRVPIQACNHPDVVCVLPDASISLGRAPDSLGLGFAVGAPAHLPDFWKVSQKLRQGYLPIVESRWNIGVIAVEQTTLAILPRDADVVTGKETQYVIVRMTVENKSATPQSAPLCVLIGKMDGSQNLMYRPYVGPASRWQAAPMKIAMQDSTLTLDSRTLLCYRCDLPKAAALHAKLEVAQSPSAVQNRSGQPGAAVPQILTNCLRFDVQLKPGEKRIVDLVVAGTSKLYPASERQKMRQIEFDSALERATADWQRHLTPGMEYVTPEPRLNNLYKQMILSCLQNTLQTPDRPWHEPLQSPTGGMYSGVWGWEFAHMATPMIAAGYQYEMRPSLRYFTERQSGIGKYTDGRKPVGDVKSAKGAYVGAVAGGWIAWINETGAILWALAAEYHYSRDVEWLKTNRPSILAACDWVQTACAQTRVTGKDGKKVPHYGLLPAGQPGDVEGKWYVFTFNDNFTWFGMSQIAAAFRQAGLPEADRLAREANEYRDRILDAIRQEQYVDPETKLLFVPNMIGYHQSTSRDPFWFGDGPVQLFDTGLFRPSDERFKPMVEYARRKYGILLGLAEHFGGGNEWYPNQTERSYYKCFLARGEIEKSLLVFYSNVVYGRSSDTYQSSERFHLNDPNFSAWQPNASGNGRQLDMMRRMLVDEQDAAEGRLWLLRGCPRRWFAKGQSIIVKKAPTLFGEMSVVMHSDGDTITIDVDSPKWEPPHEIRLVLRHPDRKPIAKATVNGKEAAIDGETIILPKPTGRLYIVCKYQ